MISIARQRLAAERKNWRKDHPHVCTTACTGS